MVHCIKFLSGYLIQGVSIDFSTPYIIYIIFNYPISEHGFSERVFLSGSCVAGRAEWLYSSS